MVGAIAQPGGDQRIMKASEVGVRPPSAKSDDETCAVDKFAIVLVENGCLGPHCYKFRSSMCVLIDLNQF